MFPLQCGYKKCLKLTEIHDERIKVYNILSLRIPWVQLSDLRLRNIDLLDTHEFV
jgi:hypothetical protein